MGCRVELISLFAVDSGQVRRFFSRRKSQDENMSILGKRNSSHVGTATRWQDSR